MLSSNRIVWDDVGSGAQLQAETEWVQLSWRWQDIEILGKLWWKSQQGVKDIVLQREEKIPNGMDATNRWPYIVD